MTTTLQEYPELFFGFGSSQSIYCTRFEQLELCSPCCELNIPQVLLYLTNIGTLPASPSNLTNLSSAEMKSSETLDEYVKLPWCAEEKVINMFSWIM